MGKIITLGSGSSGNCYILETKGERLILELGIPWKDIVKGLRFDIADVSGALVTHIHSDHSKSIRGVLNYQIPVFSNQDVAEHYEGVKVLQNGHKYKIGGFVVQPISVEHNAPNYAYLIEHEEMGRILFVTDCVSFPYNVKNLRCVLIEANYSQDICLDKVCEGYEIRSHNEYHMEINKTLEALDRLNNLNLDKVMLIHLSNGQSNEQLFQDMVAERIGKKPFVADKGVEFEINKEDF